MGSLKLFPMPRRPSATAAETRARRAKARAWARERGYEPYKDRFCTDDCSGFNTGHLWSGFLLPLHDRTERAPICVECIPYDGAPLRNHEHWGDRDPLNTCVRCFRSMEERGGSYMRGGPICWECGGCTGIERDIYEGWLLALRKDPDLPPPWRGDKAVRP